jgi:Flp pilus assembly pilin Flp
MKALLLRFLRDESGRGVAEALLVTGTGLVIIPTIDNVGVKLAAVFAKLTKALH